MISMRLFLLLDIVFVWAFIPRPFHQVWKSARPRHIDQTDSLRPPRTQMCASVQSMVQYIENMAKTNTAQRKNCAVYDPLFLLSPFFDGSAYDPQLMSYIANEELERVPLQYLDNGIVDGLRARYYAGLSAEDRGMAASDKTVNPVVALPAVPRSGKSTELKYFPASIAYKNYHAERINDTHPNFRVSNETPIVSIVTFNGGMRFHNASDALGLRIIYGALKSANLTESTWPQFLAQFPELADLSGAQAVLMMRQVFGDDRLIFVGVDELAKSKDPESIGRDLGDILDGDRRTDCVVTALTPQYIDNLVLGSQRRVVYVPVKVHALTITEYDAIQKRILSAWHRYSDEPLGPFAKRIIKSLPILAGGHFGTIVNIVDGATDGSLEQLLRRYHREGSSAMDLIWQLCSSEMFRSPLHPPASSAELELTLSVKPRDVGDVSETLFRSMVEGSRCILFDHKAKMDMGIIRTTARSPKSSVDFRPGMTLAMFFRKLTDISTTPDNLLGPLARAAKALFAGVLELTEFWERACVLSFYAHVVEYHAPSHVRREIDMMLPIPPFSQCIFVTKSIQLVIGGSPLEHPYNSLVVGAQHQRGWDFCMCGTTMDRLAAYVYAQVKISSSASRQWDYTVASALANVLDEHFGNRMLSQEDEDEELRRVCVVFMCYDDTCSADDFHGSMWRDWVLAELQKRLRNALEKAPAEASADTEDVLRIGHITRAIRYVKSHWAGNIRMLDKSGLEDFCIPTFLPLAQLVQTVDPSSAVYATASGSQ